MRLRPVLFAMSMSSSLAAGRGAGAQTVDEHLRAGFALRQRGAEVEALTRFEAAWSLARAPRVAAQVGLTHQALGHWVEADRFLRLAREARSDPWVRLHQASLDAALRVVRQHVGEVELVGEPAGALVSVDGRPVGTLPLAAPLCVIAGTVNLELRAEGHLPVHRRLVVDPGATLREEVLLALAPPPPPVEAPPVVAPPVVAPVAPPVVLASPRPAVTGTPPLRVLGTVLTAVGGAATAFGVVAVALRETTAQEYNRDCPEPSPGIPSDCRALLDAESTWGTARWVGLAAGGALLVGGLSALLLDRRPSAHVAWRCEPGWRALACEVRF